MRVTSTELRKDIYNILDKVLETGIPVEIVRHHQILQIVSKKRPARLKKLKPIPHLINGDITELDNIDWSKEWKP
jgi:hypothetical protein